MKRSTKLERKTPLRPGEPLRSRSRIKPVNRERIAEKHDRNFGEEAERVRAKPCLCAHQDARAFFVELQASFAAGEGDAVIICRGSVVAAHVTARGMGASKGGRFDLVPLCDAHHREAGEAETSQRAAFEQRYGLDLRAKADAVALGHPRPLGIRGLADRFALGLVPRCDCGHVWEQRPDGCDCLVPRKVEPLDSYETDALLGWVRREMAREVERRVRRVREEVDVWKAADREALSYHIEQTLGGCFASDPGRPIGLAWSLCEAAGWPS